MITMYIALGEQNCKTGKQTSNKGLILSCWRVAPRVPSLYSKTKLCPIHIFIYIYNFHVVSILELKIILGF